jgi:outer membrane protein
LNIRSVVVLALLALPAAAQETPAPPQPPAAPSSTAAAVAPVPLTLPEALRRALADNPAVARARAEIAAAQAQKRITLSAVLPRLGVNGVFTRNSSEAGFGSGADRRIILPGTNWNYQLSLSQPIFAGLRDRRALQQSRLGIDAAQQGELGAEETVILAVAADYLGVLEGDELIDVERRNLELTRRRRQQAQDLYEAGETTRVDALRAEADVKAAERRVADAQQAREAAAGRLRLDLALEAPVQVSEPRELLPSLPAEPQLAAQAEARRPEVAQAQTALDIAKLEVSKQRGALLPVVTASGGWINQKSAFPADNYGFLSLQLSVPIFQGGEVGARVALAKERQRQAELRLAELKQSVREEVHQSLVGLATAEANLGLAREQLAAAEAEYDQATELYRAEEITALEAETAEISLADARRAVTTSRLDRRLAQLRVLAAAGLLEQAALPEVAP